MNSSRPTPRTDQLPPEIVGRVLTTVSSTQTDGIAKVDGAGSIRQVDGRAVQVMHNGILVEAGGYFGDWMAEIIRCLRGHHEPQEEAVFHQVVERLRRETPTAPVIIELGSFWSYYAMWFCRSLAGGRALLMEPDSENLDLGRRNFALNDLSDRAHFVHGIIGADPGSETEFAGDDGTIHYVTQYDLRSLMDADALEYVDVVLSDIQGAESVLLERGRAEFARGRVRFLIVSTHHHSISGNALTHQQALIALRGAGAHVIAEHTIAESFSGDGLIAVSFDPRDKDFTIELQTARARDSLFGELEWDLDAARHRADLAEGEVARLRDELASRPQQSGPRPSLLARARAALR